MLMVWVQVLFYEDNARIREFQEKFKTYEEKFPQCRRLQSPLPTSPTDPDPQGPSKPTA